MAASSAGAAATSGHMVGATAGTKAAAGAQSVAQTAAQQGSLAALAASLRQSHPCTLSLKKKSGCVDTKDVKPFTLTNWSSPLVKSPPRDLGGTLQIKWTASPQAARYEVYRANATRASVPQVVAPSTTMVSCSTGSGGSQKANVGGKSITVSAPLCSATGTKVSAVALGWQALGDPAGSAGFALGSSDTPTGKAGVSSSATGGNAAGTGTQLQDSDFVLLGSTTKPEYDDALSRSSAHYYVYRVVPVNRWNVPGPLLSVTARAPATLPPAAPKLLVGTANTDGGVDVQFVPVGDAGEEIKTYQLWRITLSSALLQQAAASAASGTTGAASTGSTVSKSSAATAAQAAANHGAVSGSGATKVATGTSGTAATTTSSLGASGPPASSALAGAAARYGVAMHRPVMVAAVRTGMGLPSVVTQQNLQAQSATMVATLSSDKATTGSQVWISEALSSSLDWRDDYAYWVRAVDTDSLQSDSEPVDVTPLKVSAAAPTGLSASWNTASCEVDVTWQGADPEPAGYIVERELVPSTSSSNTVTTKGGQSINLNLPSVTSALQDQYIQLGGIVQAPASQYADHSGFPDSNYLYRVRTLDKAGNISPATVLATAVAVPDGCGGAATKRVLKRAAPAAPAAAAPASKDAAATSGTQSNDTSGTSGAQASGAAATSGTSASGATGSSGSPSGAPNSGAPSNTGGTPSNTDTDTPVTSPQAPTVAKPADEIDIPATRPPQ